jgi:uncharacterized protein (TIGR00255 family)
VLLSMTGFGDAASEADGLHVAAEIRTVNNRYLKLACKLPDAYVPLESRIEKVVRESVSRGTVQVALRVEQIGVSRRYTLDKTVLSGYWRELCEWSDEVGLCRPTSVDALLSLPGAVIEGGTGAADLDAEWPTMEATLRVALERLRLFREEEGRAIREDLQGNAARISAELEQISARAPQVIAEYREKLHERVRVILEETDAKLDASDLIRDVSLFADRCDISEEIQRLRCHLEQFAAFLDAEKSMGRKLDFLSQEMFREVNTIGSKANNVEIAHCVVEMKAAVEKIRENLQNVE